MRDLLLKKFEEEYRRLNEEQRRAVDAIEGPVMVIAGPGTGKTQILSARIGRILLSDAQLDPGNILCLTYTEAGVVAMRRRLLQFIGPDAYKVAIHTFHAFCNEVIQHNLSLFERTELEPVSDLERIELLRALIDSLPNDHPLKRNRGDVYYEIGPLYGLFAQIKKEGWDPDHLCRCVDEYLADLPNRDGYVYKVNGKGYKKGDLRTAKIEEETVRMRKLQAACTAFRQYEALMKERQRYDFEDMINWVIRAFDNDPDLLRHYQEQYQYILIDEYQDTSGAQNRIVELLISYWDKPNVFVVGDDDQSIFRFQGANVENMLAFAQKYSKDLLTIVLRNNYRSTQPILDVSRTLIGTNTERLVRRLEGLSKDLVASAAHLQGLHHKPVIHRYLTARDELIGLTLEVEKVLAEGHPPPSIGIIYKEHRIGDDLAAFLRLRGIPFHTKRHLNILDQPLIRQLMVLLRYLSSEHRLPYSGDELLFELLHFEWWSVPPVEIARASIETAAGRKSPSGARSLREHLANKAAAPQTDLFDITLHASLREAVRRIEDLIGSVPNLALLPLLEKVVREGGFLGHIMRSPERPWLMQLLSTFYDFVKEEVRRQPTLTLEELTDRIRLMRKEGLPIELVQITGAEGGVHLMTAHGSKGLEFDHVFVAGCISKTWEKKKRPNTGYKLPDTVFTNAASGSEEEEVRRLFYVALTRAKKTLTLSYSEFNDAGKEQEPSQFLAEVRTGYELPVLAIAHPPEVKTAFQELLFNGGLAPELAGLDDELADWAVNRFVMNVSALNDYLNCPLGFYYRHIVRIPSPANEAMEFGSAVHYALEHFFRPAREEGFPPVERLVALFGEYMRRHRESFTAQEFTRRSEYGARILRAYYDRYIGEWSRAVSVELNLGGVVVDGVPMKGKIDKVEFSGRDALVVDYKSGNPENGIKKMARPSAKEPLGGDYWRQAAFYHLLVSESKDWNVRGLLFDFIEPDSSGAYRKERLEINALDLEAVREQIRTVWNAVQRKDFYTGCGAEDCHWCTFVKTSRLAVALHELPVEEGELPVRRNTLRVS